MTYKTVPITDGTTPRQLVADLLAKFRMRHTDPKLFYLALEVLFAKRGEALLYPPEAFYARGALREER